MKLLDGKADPDGFFARLAAVPRRALLLDYDGTLAPFREERGAAVPYPGVREAVGAILKAGHTRLVVISGRAVHDLLPLLAVEPPPELWGCHGWERLRSDGTYEVGQIGARAHDALARAEAMLRARGLGEHTERKPVTVALHWRGLEPARVEELRRSTVAEWASAAQEAGLEIHEFDGGLELRMPGRDKGVAVRSILAEMEPPCLAAYLGDDLTDEDAFRALGGNGLSVLVREQLRPTEAQLWIQPPAELLDFLRRWHDACGGV